MTQEQRRELIREQLTETPEKSDRQIAKQIGVTHPFVGNIRYDMEQSGELEAVTSSVGADGKERPRNRKPASFYNPDDYEKDIVEHVKEESRRSGVPATRARTIEIIDERKRQAAEWVSEKHKEIDRNFDNLKVFRKALANPALYGLLDNMAGFLRRKSALSL